MSNPGNTPSEKPKPKENVLLQLYYVYENKQEARAQQVLDLLNQRPAYPNSDGLSPRDAAHQLICWKVECELWKKKWEELIVNNLDHESIWQFVKLASKKDVKEAIKFGSQIHAEMVAEKLRARNKASAEAGHSKAGGSREKREKIQAIWKTGKYATKTACIEKEHVQLGMSLSTAEKALRSLKRPKPS